MEVYHYFLIFGVYTFGILTGVLIEYRIFRHSRSIPLNKPNNQPPQAVAGHDYLAHDKPNSSSSGVIIMDEKHEKKLAEAREDS